MDDGWLGTREAAEELGISQRTLYRLIDEGALVAYHIGRNLRIRRSDLEAFLAASRVVPGSLGTRRGSHSRSGGGEVLT